MQRNPVGNCSHLPAIQVSNQPPNAPNAAAWGEDVAALPHSQAQGWTDRAVALDEHHQSDFFLFRNPFKASASKTSHASKQMDFIFMLGKVLLGY